jgi:multiple antibiotic resistance protein
MIESAILLMLVVDPFGNLAFVLAVTGELSRARYRLVILRETSLAILILATFALAGEYILGYLNVERASLTVAGGVILFLISLKMIFHSAANIFEDNYREDPILVPIAVPSLAGPSAITTVMVLRSQQQTGMGSLLLALCVVLLATAAIFLLGRRISDYLGQRGLRALEKFMGLLLNLVAVNMILVGVREFLATA